MIYLTKLETRDDNTPSHFSTISIEPSLKKVFSCKHVNKYLNTIAKNDAYLGRKTIFAISYNDGDQFAQFSLLKTA